MRRTSGVAQGAAILSELVIEWLLKGSKLKVGLPRHCRQESGHYWLKGRSIRAMSQKVPRRTWK